MLRLSAALAAAVVLAGAVCRETAFAHAGLQLSEPLAGATLGDTPTDGAARLLGTRRRRRFRTSGCSTSSGAAKQIGSPQPVADDPLSLTVQVEPLAAASTPLAGVSSPRSTAMPRRGLRLRRRSAPTDEAVAAARATNPVTSPLEVLGRWMFLLGLVALIGAATASVARFGGAAPT